MNERPTCVECAQRAPETNTDHTLISSAFGWRLTRAVGPDGTKTLQWHCAWCWRKRKTAQTPK